MLEKGNSGEAAELKSGDAGCGMRRCGDAAMRVGGRVKRLERLEKL
jgi:hypothetical protein